MALDQFNPLLLAQLPDDPPDTASELPICNLRGTAALRRHRGIGVASRGLNARVRPNPTSSATPQWGSRTCYRRLPPLGGSGLPVTDDPASVLRHKNDVILAVPADVRLALPVSHENLLPSERGGSLKGGSLLHSAARRNGRASASLTARGGGLPVGVTVGGDHGGSGSSMTGSGMLITLYCG